MLKCRLHLMGMQNVILDKVALKEQYTVVQACQTEGPRRAIWVTFVLS